MPPLSFSLKLRYLTAILIINFVIFAAGILLLEVGFGKWRDKSPTAQLDIIRNLKSKINFSGIGEPADKKERFYIRDQYGFRGKYPSPDKIDILTVGGSTTAETYVGEGETWQDILSADFSANSKTVSIANAGMEGQTTYGHIQSFQLWFSHIPDLKPRYVLVYTGINDLSLSLDYHADELDFHLSPREVFKSKSAFFIAYNNFMLWYHRIPRCMYRYARQPQEKIDWTDKPVLSNHDTLFAPYLKNYEKRLNLILAEIRKIGANPIFMTQTMRNFKIVDGQLWGDKNIDDENGLMMNGIDQYYFLKAVNQTLLKVCREANGICIDLANELTFEDSDLYDTIHTNFSGSAKIGHYLYENLKNYL